jgi:polyribonucleotide nucleotidyltransferase
LTENTINLIENTTNLSLNTRNLTENTINLTENTTNLTEKQERYKKVSRINKNIINQYYTKKLIQSLHTLRKIYHTLVR